MHETTQQPGSPGSNSMIALCYAEGVWSAQWTAGDSSPYRLTITGAKTPAGAVLGAASKFATSTRQPRGRGVVPPEMLTVRFPAFAGPLDSLSDPSSTRLRERLDRYGITLVPDESIAPLPAAQVGLMDQDLDGEVRTGLRPRMSRRAASIRQQAADAGAVVYWISGSAIDQSRFNTGFGGWSWICEDGRFASGSTTGDEIAAAWDAARAAMADADARGLTALLVTTCRSVGGTEGVVKNLDAHLVRKVPRATHRTLNRAHKLSLAAAHENKDRQPQSA